MLIQTGRPNPLSNPSTAVAVCLILAAVLAAYGAALLNGFLIDDHALITDNPLLHEPGRLPDLLKSPYMRVYYRPAVLFSFFLDYRVWGLSAFGYHLTNLILHAINALLVFFFIGRLFRNPLWALWPASSLPSIRYRPSRSITSPTAATSSPPSFLFWP